MIGFYNTKWLFELLYAQHRKIGTLSIEFLRYANLLLEYITGVYLITHYTKSL